MIEHVVETICFGSKKDLIKRVNSYGQDEIKHLDKYIWVEKPIRIRSSYKNSKDTGELVGYIVTKSPVCASKEGDRYKYKDVWLHYKDLLEDEHRYETIEYDIEVE